MCVCVFSDKWFIVFGFVFCSFFDSRDVLGVWYRLIYLHYALNRSLLCINILDFDFLLLQLNWMINNGRCCHSTTIKIIIILMNSQIKRYLGFLLSVIAFNDHYFNCKFPYKDTLNDIQNAKNAESNRLTNKSSKCFRSPNTKYMLVLHVVWCHECVWNTVRLYSTFNLCPLCVRN